MTLLTCPYCPAHVRSDRLEKHVLRVHPTSQPLSGKHSPKAPSAQSSQSVQQRLRGRKVRSGMWRRRCSHCGFTQKLTPNYLVCTRCGRTDNNPVVVLPVSRPAQERQRKKLLSFLQTLTDEKLSIYANNPNHKLVYELAVIMFAERAKEREAKAEKGKKRVSLQPASKVPSSSYTRSRHQSTRTQKGRVGPWWDESKGCKNTTWDENAGPDEWRLHGA
jgi:hypothetical protein